MTIKELADQLQDKINQEIVSFCEMQKTIQSIEESMALIVSNLEPVESIVFQQNPHLEDIFNRLK